MGMVLQQDSESLRNWAFGAIHPAFGADKNSFVHAFAEAVCRADSENYLVLRPALIELARKYPQYERFGKD
jgi:hypothetical protein